YRFVTGDFGIGLVLGQNGAGIVAAGYHGLRAAIIDERADFGDFRQALFGDFIVDNAGPVAIRTDVRVLGEVEAECIHLFRCLGCVRVLGGGFGRCRLRRALFAGLIFAKVMPHSHADLLQSFLPDTRNLLELFGGHVGQSFHRGDSGRYEFLDDRFAQLADLLDGRGGGTGQGLHLLLDLLALFFLALDIDFPAQQLGREPDILAFFADRQGKLRVVDDDFQLLIGQIGNADAADLRGLQRLLGEGGDLLAEFDDVDL